MACLVGCQKNVICAVAPGSREDLLSVEELIEAGKVKPVIDRCFPLSGTAADFRYYMEGHARGKVVINVE